MVPFLALLFFFFAIPAGACSTRFAVAEHKRTAVITAVFCTGRPAQLLDDLSMTCKTSASCGGIDQQSLGSGIRSINHQ